MRKKIMIAIAAVFVTTALAALWHVKAKYFTYSNTATYHLYANKLDMEVVAEKPQKIIKELAQKPVYELTVSVTPEEKDISCAMLGSGYPEDVSEYLKSTMNIQSDDPLVKELAYSIAKDEKNIKNIVNNTTKWINSNIEFDFVYTASIRSGFEDDRGAKETIELKLGGKYQYPEVFVAIMRALGIPARLAVGHIFGDATQAWTEIFVNGQGWVAVNPYTGDINIDNRYVKLFEVADPVEMHVKNDEIGVGIRKIY